MTIDYGVFKIRDWRDSSCRNWDFDHITDQQPERIERIVDMLDTEIEMKSR